MKPHSYIYKITDLTNMKTYIGRRRFYEKEKWDNYYGSGKLITKAVLEKGKENFKKDLVEYVYDVNDVEKVETACIKYYKSIGKAEYNISLSGYANCVRGGYLQHYTEEQKIIHAQKVREAFSNSEKKKQYDKRVKKANEEIRIVQIKENQDKIIDLYTNENMAMDKISKKLNLTRTVVRRSLVENNINLYKSHSESSKHKISQSLKDKFHKSRHIIKCPNCNIDFEANKRKNRKYCSKKCHYKSRSKERDLRLNSMNVELIIDLRNQGLSFVKISEITGYDRKECSTLLKRYQ